MKIIFAATLLALALAGTAQAQQNWQHYQGPGFSMDYPPGWTVDPSFLDKGYAFFQGQSDDVRAGIAFSPAYDLAPGTNLESDQLKLVVEPARPGDLCSAAAFLVTPSRDYETRRLIDKPDVVRTFAEPGDRYAVEQAVVIVSHKPCIAVHYFVTYSRTMDRNRAPFDHEQLYRALQAIAETLKPGP